MDRQHTLAYARLAVVALALILVTVTGLTHLIPPGNCPGLSPC